jgi:hypothetical protein
MECDREIVDFLDLQKGDEFEYLHCLPRQNPDQKIRWLVQLKHGSTIAASQIPDPATGQQLLHISLLPDSAQRKVRLLHRLTDKPWNERWLDLKRELNAIVPAFLQANRLPLITYVQEALRANFTPGVDAIQCCLEFASPRGFKNISLVVESIPNEAFEIRLFSLAPNPGRRIFRGKSICDAIVAVRQELAITIDQLNRGQEQVTRLY